MHRKVQTDVHTKKYITRIAQDFQHLRLQAAELNLTITHSPVTVGQFTSPSLLQINKQAAHCSQTSVLFFFILTTQEMLLIQQLLNHINLRLIKRPCFEWQYLLCHRRTNSLFPINKCYYPGIELLSGELVACFLRCINTLSALHYGQINCPFTKKGYQSDAVISFSSPSVYFLQPVLDCTEKTWARIKLGHSNVEKEEKIFTS